MRMLNQNLVPAALVSELPLKLARKCVEAFGVAAFEEEPSPQGISTGLEEEIASVCMGKEFGLIRTISGKVNCFCQQPKKLVHCVLTPAGIFLRKSCCSRYQTSRCENWKVV